MTPPQVSVVIATYNYGQFVPFAIQSVLAQTFASFELIIVDDGSTDNTQQIMEQYLVDTRVRYCRTENRGQPAAKNLGISLSRGQLIAFLDGDDIWMPNKLTRQIPLFETHPKVGVVFCQRHTIDPAGRTIATPPRCAYRGDVLAEIFRDNFITFSSSVVRRAVFDEVGQFREDIPLAIDYELWLRVARKYHFDYVDAPLVSYRTGHANLSRSADKRLRIVRRITKDFLKDPDTRTRFTRSFIRKAAAEHWCTVALLHAIECRPLKAVGAFARALTNEPTHWPGWRGISTVLLPSRLRSLLLRLLGRDDWRLHALRARETYSKQIHSGQDMSGLPPT
jgi:glycosyltransferase involved in cell wall biosynthesis